jgi:integrase/recombinase XerD
MAHIKVCINDYYKRRDCSSFVYLVTYVNNQKVTINTKVKVMISDWDPGEGIIKGSYKKIKDDNLIIRNCYARLNDVFVRYRLMNKGLTKDILMKEYKTPSGSESFYHFIEDIISKKKGLNSEHTIHTYNTLLGKLKKFRPAMTFHDITCDMVNDFQKFLKAKKTTNEPDAINNNPNTVSKTLKLLKVFINEAVRRKLLESSPFNSIKIKRVEADREFLLPDELKKLMETYKGTILPDLYRKTMRAFLFSCFTGLRISDVRALRMEDIQKDMLVITPVKTENIMKSLRIPLTKPARMLIKDAAPNRIYGHIFDMETNQSVNRKLKSILEGINIKKRISFHCGRHTFATIFLLEGGKVQVLQKLLGHYSITETMKYVHIIPDDMEEQVKVFNKYV